MGCDPIIDGVAGAVAAAVAFDDDSRQVTTTLAAISNQSIAEPLGLWTLDKTLVEEVTGGAGNDLTTGFDGILAWNLFQGVPNIDDKYAGWYDGSTGNEANGGGNPGSTWNLNASLTVMCWAKMDYYAAEGGDNDIYVCVTFVNRSSTTLGTGTAPPYRLGFNGRKDDGKGASPLAQYYDAADGTTIIALAHDAADGLAVKTPLGKWVHLAMTRLRNGANDNDVTLFVNGEQVDQLLAQNDSTLPTSTNCRLQVGQGRGGTNGFPGSIRDVAIWNSRLTPAEVKTMFEIGIGDAV
jgi:hypothetical protein